MRHLIPAESLIWRVLVVTALVIIAAFLAIEVFDLDGSAVANRLVQPPISAPFPLANPDVVIRYAAFSPELTRVVPNADIIPFIVWLWPQPTIPSLRVRLLLRDHLPHHHVAAPPRSDDLPMIEPLTC